MANTTVEAVYDAFLKKILSDEWNLDNGTDIAIAKSDWRSFLDTAIFRFKFPRKNLIYENDIFEEELGNAEIQVLATYMKHEWVKRCVASWENIRTLYTDADFSQANHLDKLIKLESHCAEDCLVAEGIYDRARDGSAKAFGFNLRK